LCHVTLKLAVSRSRPSVPYGTNLCFYDMYHRLNTWLVVVAEPASDAMWRRDETKPLVGVNALSFLKCLALLVGDRKAVWLIIKSQRLSSGKSDNIGLLSGWVTWVQYPYSCSCFRVCMARCSLCHRSGNLYSSTN